MSLTFEQKVDQQLAVETVEMGLSMGQTRDHPRAQRIFTGANYPLEYTTVVARFIARFEKAADDGTLCTPQRPRSKGQCMLWPGARQGGTTPNYGAMMLVSNLNIKIATHVLVARLFMFDGGPIPEGQQVNHTCDDKLCCEPNHLYLGTHQMNMSDLKHRGSWAYQMRVEKEMYR